MGAKRIAFINGKGGVGKTTSVFNLAATLAVEHEEKILVIDADKQKNTTALFTMNTEEDEIPEKSLMDFLKGADPKECICKSYFRPRGNMNPRYYGIDVMIADIALADEGNYSDLNLKTIKKRFEKFVTDEKYDWVLVDMPPSNMALNKAIFGCFVDYVLVPFSSDNFSIDGYGDIMDEVDMGRGLNPKLEILGVYLARYSNWASHRWAKGEIANFKEYIDVQIPHCSEIADAMILGKPVCFNANSSSKAKPAYEKLIKEINKKLKKNVIKVK